MKQLSTQSISLLITLFVGLFWQCQDMTPLESPEVALSADKNEVNQRLSNECAFRYTIANSYAGLDNNSQREAIRAGFATWQRVSRNLSFIEFATPERAALFVRFVSPTEMQAKPVMSSVGLLRSSITVTSALRQESNGTVTILLDNTYNWDTNALTRAIAYHAGLVLGVATSTDANSLMWPMLQKQVATPSKADSMAINRLYVSPCATYLPISLTVGGPVTKTIKFDKQGTVLIKASGQMTVGEYVGLSSPEGREVGLFGFKLTAYNIVPNMFHAALMYKINDEANWHYCGPLCSFSTAGNQSINLTLNINDKDLTDDVGGYDVAVDYK